MQHSLEDVQLVLVDDGSTDYSYRICRNYLGNRATIISQTNQGLSASRNRGIEEATGEYILFLDSDDILLSTGFSALLDAINTNNVDVIMGKYVAMQERGRDIWPSYTFPKASTVDEARKAIYSQVPDSIWNAWRYVCKREFLLENKLLFRPGIICEDMEWTPKVLERAKSISFLEEPFYGYYYNRPGSITKTSKVKRLFDVNNIVVEYADKYSSQLVRRMVRESFLCISRYCQCNKLERKQLRAIMEMAIENYHYSASIIITLFLKSRPIVPLYLWSLSLLLAKTGRGFLKPVLGPVKSG